MKKILIVEDNPLVCELIMSSLRMLPHSVRAVRTAEEALDAMRAERPDLVLCDVLLPGRSGADLVRHIRNTGAHDMKVVAVTTLAGRNDAAKLKASGFDGIITKPIDPATFAADVARRLR